MHLKLVAAVGASCLLLGAAPAPDWQTSFLSLKANAEANRCEPAISDAQKLLRANPPAEVAELTTNFANVVIIICRYQLNEPAKGAAAARAALQQNPGNLDIAKSWLASALDSNKTEDAAEALTAAIRGAKGDISETIEPDMVWDLLRRLNRADRQADADALELLLAGNGYGGDNPGLRDAFRQTAARVAIGKGDLAAAEAASAGMTDQDTLLQMLTEVDYQPLWPKLEAQVGPGLSRLHELALKEAEARADRLGVAEQSPEATKAQRQLMEALWNANQRKRALAVGADGFSSPAALAGATEDGGWLVNLHAALLTADGQVDAAIRRMDGLTNLGMETRPWLISMRINRGLMLLDHGRSAQLLTEIDALAADADKYGSPYARQLVRHLRICSLAEAGRAAEAAPVRAEMLKDESEAPFAIMRALMCLNETDNAARLMLKALDDTRTRSGAIQNLQPVYSWDDPKPSTLRPLLARPDVAAAYAKVGRDLPEALR